VVADAPGSSSEPRRLRLALTLPGAVSLGAYHGGALAALLVAAQHAEGRLVIDAMAAASAGSITGLLAARALLEGADPVALMARAWVESDSLHALRSSDTTSVLTAKPLRDLAEDLLSADGSIPAGGAEVARQADPVQISMALASLGGLGYRVPSLDPDQPTFQALTHLDWWTGRFTPDDPDQFLRATEPALASAANALGFPPVLLDRSADRDDYVRNHILDLPPEGSPWRVWYTDGGTIDNEPFGRVIELLDRAEEQGDLAGDALDDERLLLLVEPQPATVDRAGRWWDPTYHPRWTFTLFDVFNLKGDQSIYGDLLKLEKTNSRVQWSGDASEAIGDALTDALAALDEVSPERRAEVEGRIRDRLGRALDTMAADRARLAAQQDADGSAPDAAATTGEVATNGDRSRELSAVVTELVQRASGLHGKRQARVEMVSPLLDGDAPPVADRLAGDFLFHFGGFVDEDFRRHDFLVGWSNMRTWLGQRSDRHGLEAALVEVDRRHAELGWDLVDDNPSLRSLPLGDKWQLLRTAAHVGRVITHDLERLVDKDDDTQG